MTKPKDLRRLKLADKVQGYVSSITGMSCDHVTLDHMTYIVENAVHLVTIACDEDCTHAQVLHKRKDGYRPEGIDLEVLATIRIPDEYDESDNLKPVRAEIVPDCKFVKQGTELVHGWSLICTFETTDGKARTKYRLDLPEIFGSKNVAEQCRDNVLTNGCTAYGHDVWTYLTASPVLD